jgi:chemotaxis-related protein WspB
MQLLTFTVAGESYAIESRRVVEVLPLVPARPIPRTPAYVRGVFTYRGSLVPLIDLGRRLADTAPQERLSTRVVVAEYRPPGAGGPTRLGLVAENVTSIIAAERAETSRPALDLESAPFLGGMLRIGGRTVQLVEIDRLLPPEIAAGLFPASTPEVAS